jgi:thioredoxin reductase (NADPH)
MLSKSGKNVYDLVVIGGGSGGMSTARKSARLGKKVALLDYVTPSPQGTTWGMGGTCVNVGCIPKKLMHYSSIFGEMRKEQQQAGWDLDTDGSFNWERMRKNVNQHVKNINEYYSKAVVKENVTYINKLGSIVDGNTVKAYVPNDDGSEELLTTDNILIATGGRPRHLDIPGLKENSITSDDIFWRNEEPGKTLVIGAGYIGLECGGFLTGNISFWFVCVNFA